MGLRKGEENFREILLNSKEVSAYCYNFLWGGGVPQMIFLGSLPKCAYASNSPIYRAPTSGLLFAVS